MTKISFSWEQISWCKLEKQTLELQDRIYKASLNNKFKKVHKLQKILTHSLTAKLVAVKYVSINKKFLFEVNDFVILTKQQKYKIAQNLCFDRKNISFASKTTEQPKLKEKSFLPISVFIDKCKQTLAKMALEPEWKAKNTITLLGYNSARFEMKPNTDKTIKYIYSCLNCLKNQKFVVTNRIKNSFNQINTKLFLNKLNTYPEMKMQIKHWLNAKIMDEMNLIQEYSENFKFNVHKNVIAPVLADVILSDLETYMNLNLSTAEIKCYLIRYVDKILIISNNLKKIVEVQKFLDIGLSNVGLEFQYKTNKVINLKQGFDFIGFNFRIIPQTKRHIQNTTQLINCNNNPFQMFTLKVLPSRKSKVFFLNKIKFIIKFNKGKSATNLIKTLLPNIIRWVNYFKYSKCTSIFCKLDYEIHRKLWLWAINRHRNWNNQKIREKVFSYQVYMAL